jgi:tRNA threonylcarbamoyladenosine biosynthesis protein TsaB
MKLLSISTASDILSLSILENQNLIQTFSSVGNKRHAELISPTIKELMQKANLKFADLDGIAVNLGPGSFTGLRVGLSTAKGIAYGAKIKIYGYTNFEELVYQGIVEKKIKGRVAVLIHSRKNEFYFAAYDVSNADFHQLDVFELMTIEDVKTHVHNFDLILVEKKLFSSLSSELESISIIGLENNSYYGALLVSQNPLKYLNENYFYLEPLYLKNFDVKLKKKY